MKVDYLRVYTTGGHVFDVKGTSTQDAMNSIAGIGFASFEILNGHKLKIHVSEIVAIEENRMTAISNF